MNNYGLNMHEMVKRIFYGYKLATIKVLSLEVTIYAGYLLFVGTYIWYHIYIYT